MTEEGFWARVAKRESGCWEWTGSISSGGYGAASYKGVTHPTHRLSWMFTRGPIPRGDGYHGTVVAHKCDNRKCVNPDHLFLTDQSGNQRDRMQKGRGMEFLGPEKAAAIVQDIKDGFTSKELQTKYNVTHITIANIANRKSWKYLTEESGPLELAREAPDTTKLRTADYAQIRSMLKSGKTLREIARECGTTWPTVKRVADTYGEDVATPFKRTTKEVHARICEMFRDRISVSQIAAELKVSAVTVGRVTRAYDAKRSGVGRVYTNGFKSGQDHGNAKLSYEDVARIRESILCGARVADLAQVWGVSRTHIYRLLEKEAA